MIKDGGHVVDEPGVAGICPQHARSINDQAVEDRAASTFGASYRAVPPDDQDMRISIGGDHAGFDLKHRVKDHLKQLGLVVMDHGTHARESVDYPDFAHLVSEAVTSGASQLGIVICGSANGVNITANKHHGVRSAIAWNEEVARLAREHNNANVLALPARFVDDELALRIVDAFLAARFEGGRHQRRVDKIEAVPTQSS